MGSTHVQAAGGGSTPLMAAHRPSSPLRTNSAWQTAAAGSSCALIALFNQPLEVKPTQLGVASQSAARLGSACNLSCGPMLLPRLSFAGTTVYPASAHHSARGAGQQWVCVPTAVLRHLPAAPLFGPPSSRSPMRACAVEGRRRRQGPGVDPPRNQRPNPGALHAIGSAPHARAHEASKRVGAVRQPVGAAPQHRASKLEQGGACGQELADSTAAQQHSKHRAQRGVSCAPTTPHLACCA